MTAIEIQVAFLTFAVAMLAYLLLSLLLTVSWKRSGGPGVWLIGACGAMAFWAAVNAGAFYVPGIAAVLGSLSETVRTAGWVLFLGVLLSHYWQEYGYRDYDRIMRAAIGLGLGVLLVLDVLLAMQNLGYWPGVTLISQLAMLGRMVAAVCGVFLVDNFYRNTAAGNRWGIRLLCLGLGAIFLYDFFFYAEAVLTGDFNQKLYEARGAINALIVPLIAVSAARNPKWKLDVFLSRGIVIHTASLIGSGIYLVVMGAAGYYLRDLGGRWGAILQVSFWFGAILLLVVIVFSGQFRSRMRVLVNKHFFNYRYDYREEWLRFINTVSESDSARGLQERVIQAIADIVDSPSGALWQRDEFGHFSRAAVWNFKLPVDGSLAEDHPLTYFLEGSGWIVDLQEMPTRPELYEGCALPDWLQGEPRLWLVVPLLHHGDRLVGFIVLQRSRAPRQLNWEDHDILKTVGRQVASYLAEQSAEKALAEARQFEEFNKRFAFIMHDLKNLASQLSLLVKNADRHAGNPDFQRDMILTVKDSVGKMQLLLTRLNRLRETEMKGEAMEVNLPELLKKIVTSRQCNNTALTFSCDDPTISVAADPGQLETVFSHLVQNALDAVGQGGHVDVKVRREGDWVVASVQDDGPGMDEKFVREELFTPFRTTKENGYGIGAYEAKQLIRHFGGRLDVKSAVGRGTTMMVQLPPSPQPAAAAALSAG
ncbi:MAG: PEP-CTERM system histidine kinase PrsK [Proteobacteria bacterium]|nr:MAG: PEP-CTERM system histidine kinase PrsK [Pseudomonadota bacterium]